MAGHLPWPAAAGFPGRHVNGPTDCELVEGARRARTVTVAEDQHGEIVGFVNHVACRDPDADGSVGEVTTIYVLPEHFGEGYGRALMEAATAALSEAGFSQATLWVLTDNARARRFYEIAGWSLDGASQDATIGGQPVTEVRYRRSLG